MKSNEVKINGEIVPCNDVQEIRLIVQDGELKRQITYYRQEPVFEVVKVVVDKDVGYSIEKKVRKAYMKSQRSVG